MAAAAVSRERLGIQYKDYIVRGKGFAYGLSESATNSHNINRAVDQKVVASTQVTSPRARPLTGRKNG